MKLTEVFKSLVVEIASREEICNAIDDKKVISIFYDGDEPKGRGLRTIEPVCLFIHKDSGNTVLTGWDIEGASHKVAVGDGVLPGWRLFRTDKILSWNPTGENFSEMKAGFNPNGDKRASEIKCISKF